MLKSCRKYRSFPLWHYPYTRNYWNCESDEEDDWIVWCGYWVEQIEMCRKRGSDTQYFLVLSFLLPSDAFVSHRMPVVVLYRFPTKRRINTSYTQPRISISYPNTSIPWVRWHYLHPTTLVIRTMITVYMRTIDRTFYARSFIGRTTRNLLYTSEPSDPHPL